MFLTAHLGGKLNGVTEQSATTMREAQRGLGALSRLAEIQDENYWDTKASIANMAVATKSTADAAEKLSKFIEKLDKATEVIAENTDGRMEDITKATVGAMGAVEKQVTASGYQAEQLLADARGAVRNLEALAGNPVLAHAAVNLEAATAHTAKTAENLEAATASIREMLSPKKKSFWRRVLELMIPRPTISLGR